MKKMYETPCVEIVEIQLEGVLCSSDYENGLFDIDNFYDGGEA